MSARKTMGTALGALVLAAVGFATGAGGSAYQAREERARPWRNLIVEHEGEKGVATRTRVVFKNPELPLQAVEVLRDAEGTAELAHVALHDGREITIGYGHGGLPTELRGADGSVARITHEGISARVTFLAAGAEKGSKLVRVPAELGRALGVASIDPQRGGSLGDPLLRLAGFWLGEAWAGPPAEGNDSISVRREIDLRLVVRVPPGRDVGPGPARLEASCAPFTCLVKVPELSTPADEVVRITVAGAGERSKVADPASHEVFEPFALRARAERRVAGRVLPDVAAVIAAVGVTALACRSLELDLSVCVPGLSKRMASGAIVGVASHRITTDGAIVDERALQLYDEEQVRASLDRVVRIQVCVVRDGYARACTDLDGRPFGDEPMAAAARTVDLKRSVGGTLAGGFVITQSDGPDCKFSPSPRTSGALRLSIDSERATVTGSMHADERGTRADLRCSLGTANMTWSQNYTISASQSLTREELQAGGKLALRMKGTMSGSGGFTFNNCRSSGGASAGCPGGKRDAYAYPVELVGDVDLDAQTGSGRVVIQNAPLPTSGTWTVPRGAGQ